MSGWLRTIASRCRAIVRSRQLDREFDEELTTHLELLIDEGRRRGLSHTDARHEAIRKLGRPVALREGHREQRGIPVLDVLAQDLRYAVRMLSKSPAFTAVVTLSLALGIGANTALFSLVDGLLLRSLPVRDPDRLVLAQFAPVIRGGFKKAWPAFDKPVFDSVRADTQVFSEIVGFWRLDRPLIVLDAGAEPAREVERVSTNFFADLGVTPILGRAPAASDGDVAIISDRWWRARFGANQSVLGRAVTVDGRPFTIIGVAPQRFHGFTLESSADLWISSPAADGTLKMIGRLRPDVTHAQAQAAMHAFFRRFVRERLPEFSPDQAIETQLVPAGHGLSQLRGQYQGALLALMALVVLVLLTTCTNVGHLLMLRNSARRRELTVRAALGAGRSRLVRQYLVESTLLAAAGCAAGLVLARWGVSLILATLPLPTIPESLAFHADARILGFAAGVSLLSAILFGLAPAWRATDVELTDSLRSSQGSTPPPGARRFSRALVACQVGLSVLLLVGAGLFVQTLRNLASLDVGFNPDRLVQVSIDSRFAGYKEGQIGPVYRLLLERVGAIGGVSAVTGVRNPLMRHNLSRSLSRIPGLTLRPGELWDSVEVGPSFFETVAIPVVRGRAFSAADFERGPAVYVINETFARHYFPNDDPLTRAPSIIGVVRDVKLHGMRLDVRPTMFQMTRRESDRVNALLVRAAGDPEAIVPAIREAVQGVNPRLFVGIATMREEIERDLAKERMVASFSAFFGLVGLFLAVVGIFGVASTAVAQRTRELGIRRALGAGPWAVIRESLRDTMVVFGVGLAAGIAAAVAAVRTAASFMSDLLFGLAASDALNIAGAVLLMAVVALTACVLPARRATRIDPLAAIRHE